MPRRPALYPREDASARLVPPGAQAGRTVAFLSAVMAFFAVLMLALGLAAGRLSTEWGQSQERTGTLQIIADGAGVEEQARAALDVLRSTPGVTSVRMIGVDEQRAMLEPWIGSGAAIDSLPLPLLIEVLSEPRVLDVTALRTALAGAAPAAVYNDHDGLRDALAVSAEQVRLFAFVSVGLIVLALGAVYGLAARAAVAAGGQVIRTLRLVGARDRYIVRAFTRRHNRRALQGAIAGAALALGLTALLPQGSEPGYFLTGIGLVGWQWLVPLAVPPFVLALAWTVARVTTRRQLALQS